MATKHPRLNVVLERPMLEALGRMAKREQVSLSLKARDLIREALELHEDIALSALADERLKTLDRAKTLTHEEVWGRHAK